VCLKASRYTWNMWFGWLLALPLTDLDWFVVNDTVMGGVSSSTVELGESVLFAGDLSLEQNGGFASVRTPLPRGALVSATALQLQLRGDGRTYDVTLRRSDVPLRAGSYRVQVKTEPTGVTTVVLPLSDFQPTSFGRRVAGAPALDSDLARIDTFGVLLADKNPGAFELELLELTVIGGAVPRAEGHGDVLDGLTDAVQLGVPLFNAGNIDGCRRVYTKALEPLRDDPVLTPGERAIVGDALDGAATLDATQAAWTLRYAIDTVLAGA